MINNLNGSIIPWPVTAFAAYRNSLCAFSKHCGFVELGNSIYFTPANSQVDAEQFPNQRNIANGMVLVGKPGPYGQAMFRWMLMINLVGKCVGIKGDFKGKQIHKNPIHFVSKLEQPWGNDICRAVV